MKKAILLMSFVFSFMMTLAQPTNTNITPTPSYFDGEPYLIMNPTNSQNLVAAWMSLKYANGQLHIALKTRASFNGGTTWNTAVTLPHFSSTYGSADPSMAFDKNGTLYVCYIDYRQSPDSGGIYVSRSANGGLTWDTPSKAFDVYDVANKRPIDRPWLVVDTSSTANAGTLYITTKPAPWIPAPNRNYYKVSTDGGHTWSTIANVDGGTHLVGSLIAAPMAAPATTVDGKFIAAYPSFLASQNPLPAFYLATSTDKGQTFTYTTIYSGVASANDTNYKNGYRLAADPIDANKMVFLTPGAQNGDDDVFAFNSTNGGQTWTGPIRINDDAVSNGKGQDMVWGNYNEQGKLAVTWRDRRNASANGFLNAGYDFYYALSNDNGLTFTANQKLSSQFIAFDTLTELNGNDFMSCEYRGDTLYTVWGDTRNGKMNIYFAKTLASINTSIINTTLDGDEPQWNIFPNPASDELNVSITNELIGKVATVYDANGKVIITKTMKENDVKIITKDLVKGIYFIKIGDDARRFVKE